MPDIKFRCPECAQKIAVDAAAAGIQIDCPSCKSSLIIPVSAEAEVIVKSRRIMAVLASAGDAASDAISAKQKELDEAVAESKRLRAEAENFRNETTQAKSEKEKAAAELDRLRNDLNAISTERDNLRERTQELSWQQSIEHDMERDAEKMKQDLATALRERDELSTKMTALSPLREQLEKAERELDHAREEVVTSTKDRDILSETANRMQKTLRGLADSAPKGGIPLKDVHALLEKMAAFDRERSDLKATLKEVYSGVGSKWDEMQKQLDRMRDQLATVTMERDSMKLNADKAIGEIESMRGESGKLTTDLQNTSDQILELNENIASLKRERDELRNKATPVEALPNELVAAREEAAKVRAQYTELTRMLEAAKLDCDQARSLASERERALEKMGAVMDGAKAELAKLREEAATGDAERERFKSSSEEFGDEARELQQRVDGLLEDLHARERELSDVTLSTSTIHQRAASQEVELREVKEKLEVATARLTAREIEAREAVARLESARDSGQEAQLRLEQAERLAVTAAEKARLTEDERTRNAEQLARVTSELGSVQEQLKQARVEKEQSRSKIIELQSEMERHYDALHAVEAERDTMRSELDAVKTGLDRAKQHVSVLQARRDAMREEINRLRTKLGMPPEPLGM